MLIGQLLSAHCKRRNELIWSKGLRNELPEKNLLL